MAVPQVSMTVRITGVVFDKGSDLVRKATENAVREMVGITEERLNEVLRPRPSPGVYLTVAQAGKGASTGNYRRNLHPSVKKLFGRIDDGGVVYGPWLEGISSRNTTTRFKGYASFRKTKQWADKKTDGVLKKHITHLMRKLN